MSPHHCCSSLHSSLFLTYFSRQWCRAIRLSYLLTCLRFSVRVSVPITLVVTLCFSLCESLTLVKKTTAFDHAECVQCALEMLQNPCTFARPTLTNAHVCRRLQRKWELHCLQGRPGAGHQMSCGLEWRSANPAHSATPFWSGQSHSTTFCFSGTRQEHARGLQGAPKLHVAVV